MFDLSLNTLCESPTNNRAKKVSNFLIFGANNVVEHYGNKIEILHKDRPFKTSAFFRGGGVKNLPNLPTDSRIKLPTVRGEGSKIAKNLPTS